MSARPMTPVRSPGQSLYRMPFSPTSDYHTDDGQSSMLGRSPYKMPRSEVRAIAHRLTSLSSVLLRDQPGERVTVSISERLDELEHVIKDSISRSGNDMIDSGFVDDSFQGRSGIFDGGVAYGDSQRTSRDTSPHLEDSRQSYKSVNSQYYKDQIQNQSRILQQAQTILAGVQRANTDLRRRFADMTELNDKYADQVEQSLHDSLVLRSENDTLKSNLAHSYSELLLLKLSLRMLEAGKSSDVNIDGATHPGQDKDLHEWESLWDDVNARLRERRILHDVDPSEANIHTSLDGEANLGRDHKGNWKLAISKKREGRVQSITIRRTDTQEPGPTHDLDDHATQPSDNSDLVDAERTSTSSTSMGLSAIVTLYDQENINGVAARQDTVRSGLTADEMESNTISTVAVICDLPCAAIAASAEAPAETSAEDEKDSKDSTRDDDRRATLPGKTAWQEFLESLTDFAGMTER